ncbi:MAG: CDP-diacylglycerol--glycerol-3-phosphate 3-phosphatidyltransferase [Elusimicrobia bacterium]|nr:CDP-diacylglycerol--glycerol-3-phosphate 3-phosphatidyltransferase [Elusimicrobiota bacterium]
MKPTWLKNLPIQLTLLRIFLVPFFMVFMFVDNLWTRIFALLIFVLGGLTDLYDGMIARHLNVVTKAGIFLDPLADKLIISAALISFVGLRELHVPAWMVVCVISREFLITGLRILAVSGGRIIAADRTGKFKTTSQIIAIIIILLVLIVNSLFKKYPGIVPPPAIMSFIRSLPYWIMFVITLLTLYSGVVYLWKHRDVLISELKNNGK